MRDSPIDFGELGNPRRQLLLMKIIVMTTPAGDQQSVDWNFSFEKRAASYGKSNYGYLESE